MGQPFTMRKLLKQLSTWLFGSNPSESTLSHYQRLQQLCDSHQRINVKIKKSREPHQSLILKVDQQGHELIIDTLFPSVTAQQLKAGDTIKLLSMSAGQQLNFYTRIIQRTVTQGNTSYRLELPKELGHNHNRSSFRIYVDAERDLRIRLSPSDTALKQLTISNLSTNGIKLYFSDNVEEQLKNINYLNDVVITLPNGYNIDCQVHLLNSYILHTGKSVV